MINQMRRHVFMPLLMGGVLVASLGFIVGCGPTQPGVSRATSTPTGQSRVCAAPTSPGGIPQFTITTPDTFTFAQPPCVQAGLVDVTLVNGSPIIRQAAIVRLKESVTYDQFRTALSKQGAAALAAMTIPVGGPSIADQGLSTEVILNLVPGQYVTIDPFIGPDGTPHYIHGALSLFTVTTPTTTLPEPKADGEIVLKDFLYMLGSIKAGSSIIKVTNAGAEDHEVILGQLFPHKTLDDVKTWLQQMPPLPPPYEYVGGMSPLAKGTAGWMKLNLEAGNYVAYCLVPDPKTGEPSWMLGMIATFSAR